MEENQVKQAETEIKQEENKAKQDAAQEVVFDANDVSSHKALAIIGWIFAPILIIAGLIVDSRYIKFYANQQLWVFICELLCLIPIVGFVTGIIAFIFEIMGLIAICRGKAKCLPIFGKLNIIKWDK